MTLESRPSRKWECHCARRLAFWIQHSVSSSIVDCSCKVDLNRMSHSLAASWIVNCLLLYPPFPPMPTIARAGDKGCASCSEESIALADYTAHFILPKRLLSAMGRQNQSCLQRCGLCWWLRVNSTGLFYCFSAELQLQPSLLDRQRPTLQHNSWRSDFFFCQWVCGWQKLQPMFPA